MQEDHRQQLRDLGYLTSPVSKWVWGPTLPGWRSHLRHLCVLSATLAAVAGPLAAWTTGLTGTARVTIGLAYAVAAMIALTVSDLLMGLAMKLKPILKVLGESRLLNWFRLPVSLAIFLLLDLWLRPTLDSMTPLTKLVLLVVLAAFAWLWAGAVHLLIVSRLYWFGHNPPRFQRHKLLIALGLTVLIGLELQRPEVNDPIATTNKQPVKPVVVLAFDVPPKFQDAALPTLESWVRRDFSAREGDIASFWTSFGTGIQNHQASLLSYRLPGFQNPVSPRDRLAQPLIALLNALALAKPIPGGTRQHMYVWEILDQQGWSAYALGYWHSFPAQSRFGGVLSERWEPGHDGYPYSQGLNFTPMVPDPQLPVEPDIDAWLQRERQIWTQLQTLSSANFDFAIGYFPLADVLHSSSDEAQTSDTESELLTWRQQMMNQLLTRLPQDTEVMIILTSGRSMTAHNEVRSRVLMTPNLAQRLLPLDDVYQIAPALLDYFGLPPDARMPEWQPAAKPVYYRARAEIGDISFHDDAYLEQLKSLGYVK